TFMPSVLVETGFLTNKSEGSYLNSKSGQSQMGKAIADAILSYRNSWEQMRSIQVKIAEGDPRGSWIDTDAWNGDDDNLHYPRGENGTKKLGESFAKAAINLALSAKN
ncbi:MAG: N-acetylmuramoyl-L-alanine amidase, partial [Verrucomicrobiota bacterium]